MGLAVAPGQAAELDRVAPLTTSSRRSADRAGAGGPVSVRRPRRETGSGTSTGSGRRWRTTRPSVRSWSRSTTRSGPTSSARWRCACWYPSCPRHRCTGCWRARAHAGRPRPANRRSTGSSDRASPASCDWSRSTRSRSCQLCDLVTGPVPDATVMPGHAMWWEPLPRRAVARRPCWRPARSSPGTASPRSSGTSPVQLPRRGRAAAARPVRRGPGACCRRAPSSRVRSPSTRPAPLSATPPSDLYPAAEEAVAAGILIERGRAAGLRPRPAARGDLQQSWSGPVRAAMHRAAADVVRAEGRSTVEVADHLTQRRQTGDREAVDGAARGGRRAGRPGPGHRRRPHRCGRWT